jgi:putative oxidoreductase
MNHKNLQILNRILLGLVMLVPGLLKLFVMGSSAVVGMLSNMGFPAATFFAWVLILSEIVFGIAILANWKLKYTIWPPVIIMLVAAFTAALGNWPTFLMHLVIASNYLLLPKARN